MRRFIAALFAFALCSAPALATPPVFNGSVNALNSSAYVQPYGTIDAIKYGADPTNTTDSTTALNNAISAAITAGECAIIRPGTYKITGTVHILGSNACVIGYGATLKWGTTAPGQLTPMVLMGETSGTNNSQYQNIQGLTVDGTSVANLIGFEFGNTNMGYFGNLNALNVDGTADWAYYLYGYNAGVFYNLIGNEFVGLSAKNMTNGIYLAGDTVSGGYVTDNSFHGVHLYGVATDAIDFYANCDNNQFFGVYVAEDSNQVSPGLVFGNSDSSDSDGDGETIDGLTLDMGQAGSYALTFHKSQGNVVQGEVNLSSAQINNVDPSYSTFRVSNIGNGGAIIGAGSAVNVTDNVFNQTYVATGTATSGANYGSELAKWNYSKWNGSAPVTYYWSIYTSNAGYLYFHNSENNVNLFMQSGGQLYTNQILDQSLGATATPLCGSSGSYITNACTAVPPEFGHNICGVNSGNPCSNGGSCSLSSATTCTFTLTVPTSSNCTESGSFADTTTGVESWKSSLTTNTLTVTATVSSSQTSTAAANVHCL